MKEHLYFFDLDGTLTKRDTLLQFILFGFGIVSFLIHFPKIIFIVFLWKNGKYSAQEAKEKICSLFFKGKSRQELEKLGQDFAQKIIQSGFRKKAKETIQSAQGTIYIVSASPDIWVKPISELLGVKFISTELAFDEHNYFTGHFNGNNCVGEEKVNRIRKVFPNLEEYEVECYGDSKDDFPLLALAKREKCHYKPFRSKISIILESMRPHQWIKNGFCFFPLFFSGNITNTSAVLLSFLCFISFSFAASAIYILNDQRDIEADRWHHTKKFRPIARGDLSFSNVKYIIIFCVIASITFSILAGKVPFLCTISYIFINLFYVYQGKQKALLDVICISVGYVLRVVSSAIAINVMISNWLILMVFLLCMFLAIGKRWDDLLQVEQKISSEIIRSSLSGYNKSFILSSLTFLSCIDTVCYVLYSMDSITCTRIQTNWLFLTSFWVIIGNLRYLQLLFVYNEGVSPTKLLLKDIPIQLCVICWIIHLFILIYLR